MKQLAIPALSAVVLFSPSAAAIAATPHYIQGNYAAPQTTETTIPVPYTAAQTPGNLNVVVVGWNDSTAHVSSVTDSKGNHYQQAVGPMVTGAISQSIYYAKNISAAAAAENVVTVRFNTTALYPDIRVMEYSGIDPLNPVDTAVGATGDSLTSSSGAVNTTSATDLLVAANTVQSQTTGPGNGFTQRLLTNPDGDIAEDQIGTAPSSYSASAPLNEASGWVMQTVAFRAAASPTGSPAESVTLAWDANPPTGDPGTDTVGYRIHLGFASGNYTQTTTLGNITTVTLSNLISGTTYYYVITGYNSAGLDSAPSNEISYTAP